MYDGSFILFVVVTKPFQKLIRFLDKIEDFAHFRRVHDDNYAYTSKSIQFAINGHSHSNIIDNDDVSAILRKLENNMRV